MVGPSHKTHYLRKICIGLIALQFYHITKHYSPLCFCSLLVFPGRVFLNSLAPFKLICVSSQSPQWISEALLQCMFSDLVPVTQYDLLMTMSSSRAFCQIYSIKAWLLNQTLNILYDTLVSETLFSFLFPNSFFNSPCPAVGSVQTPEHTHCLHFH